MKQTNVTDTVVRIRRRPDQRGLKGVIRRWISELLHDMLPDVVSTVVSEVPTCITSGQQSSDVEERITQKYIYGLEGIRKEFNVGHNTAQRLKDGILRDAVLQAGPGCKIIVDREHARKLFAEHIKKEIKR